MARTKKRAWKKKDGNRKAERKNNTNKEGTDNNTNNENNEPKKESKSVMVAPIKPEFLYPKNEIQKKDLESAQGTEGNIEDRKNQRNKKKKQFQEKSDEIRMCINTVRGEECKFDKCKYEHDKMKYLEKKPKDIGEECPIYNKYGFCKYGITCRFSSKHINEKGENLINKELYEQMKDKKEILNELDKNVKSNLESKMYPYTRSMKYVDPRFSKLKKRKREENNNPKESDKKEKKEENVEVKKENEIVENSTSENMVDENISTTNNTETQQQSTDSNNNNVILSNNEITSNNENNENIVISSNIVNTTILLENNINNNNNNNNEINTGVVQEFKLEEGFTVSQPLDIKMNPREKPKIDFRGKTMLAPLTTCGNLPFRRICKEFGVDVTCGEMAYSSSITQGKASELALLKRHKSEDIFGMQICGHFFDSLMMTCEVLEDNFDVDFIDFNCGCPIDLVCNKGMCAAYLREDRNIKKLERIIRTTTNEILLETPFTLKIRTGYNGADVHEKVVPYVKDWGVSALTLHGRTRKQRYSDFADWEYIGACKKLVPDLQFIGNGDIYSQKQYHENIEKYGVDNCLIARGAILKPWIFTEIKEKRDWDISATERLDIFKKFANYGLDYWGSDSVGVFKTREFLLNFLSFSHRYIPVGLLEYQPITMNHYPHPYFGRNELETLLSSPKPSDWVKISEMFLGPVSTNFTFVPKHQAKVFTSELYN